MTSQAPGHIPSNEPSVVVKISQTEVEPEVYRLPYPPELTLKRRVSESFLQTRGYLKKRRRNLGSVHETIIDCPCLPPPTYEAAMTEPASNFDSADSTFPTASPVPNTNGDKSHTRRLSQVSEIIEKVNAKVRHLFGNRRGSAEDEHPPLNPIITQHSSIFNSKIVTAEDQSIQHHSEDLAGMGIATLPNVSEYFDINGEEGPSCFYGTIDWDTFQTTLRAQRRNTIQAQLNTDLHYDGDSDLEQLERLRQYSTETGRCGVRRERKDSQFSFSDFLKPRRFSKVDKGKGRMVNDEEGGLTLQDQPLLSPYQDNLSDAIGLSTTQTGVLPHAPSDNNLIIVSEELIGPSSQIAIDPLQWSAPVSPKDSNTPPRPEPTPRKASPRLGGTRPCPPQGQRRLSTSSTTSSSSVSSFGCTTSVTKSSGTLRRLARHIVSTPATNATDAGAYSHSKPISIPSSYHNSRHSSTIAEGSARPTNDSPTLPSSLPSSLTSSLTSSITDLPPHGYHADTIPSSPSLNPTLVPSPEAMQALHLGPPQRALLKRSVSSSSRMFHVSVEQFSTLAPTQPVSPLDGHGPSSTIVDNANNRNLTGNRDDEADFSSTHPAPPIPLASASRPLADVPSPVKRRTGSLEGSGDLRAVYIEQGRAMAMVDPLRRQSTRKSLQKKLWWDESAPSVYL